MKTSTLRGMLAILLSPFILQPQYSFAQEADSAAPPEAADAAQDAQAGDEIEPVEVEGEEPAEEEERDALFGSWGGLKDDWEAAGVTVEAVVTGDFMGLVSGGYDRGLYQTFAYQATASIDTETAGLWKGGTFLFSGLALTGQPLNSYVGDYQWSNNIDSYGVDTLQLYEAWYEHAFMEGSFSIAGGMMDYNSDFYSLDYAIPLINSSFSFGPEVAQVVNSTYPITSLGARIRIEPTETSYINVAAYDGVPGSPNNYGRTTISLEKSDGVFYAAEVGITSTEEDMVTDYFKLAVGGWFQSTDFVDYLERDRSDNGGAYIIGERKIFSECEDQAQGLGIFGQIGWAQGDRNFISQYYGAGLNYTGLIEGRDADQTMFGVASAHHADDYLDEVEGSRRAETALELSYRIVFGHGIALQPDIQYIINPGLTDENQHAVVVGTRLDIVF